MIVNGFQLSTIITKCSILDIAAVLDPPLKIEPATATCEVLFHPCSQEDYLQMNISL